jgi:peptidyl-prolyl cis-trans isomerase D
VTAITPARDRTLDEVKNEVETRWRDDEIASRLKTKAAELLDKLKSGTPFDVLAKAEGLTVETADNLKREKGTQTISANVIRSVFRIGKDGFGSAEGERPSQWVVFHVTEVTTPKFDPNSPDGKHFAEAVTRQGSDDIVGQYVASVESDLGTSVNQAALAQALGNGNNAPDTD